MFKSSNALLDNKNNPSLEELKDLIVNPGKVYFSVVYNENFLNSSLSREFCNLILDTSAKKRESIDFKPEILKAELDKNNIYKIDYPKLSQSFNNTSTEQLHNLITHMLTYVETVSPKQPLKDTYKNLGIMSLNYLKIDNRLYGDDTVLVNASVFVKQENGNKKEEVRNLVIDTENATLSLFNSKKLASSELVNKTFALLLNKQKEEIIQRIMDNRKDTKNVEFSTKKSI